jgi:hypothetical protein
VSKDAFGNQPLRIGLPLFSAPDDIGQTDREPSNALTGARNEQSDTNGPPVVTGSAFGRTKKGQRGNEQGRIEQDKDPIAVFEEEVSDGYHSGRLSFDGY